MFFLTATNMCSKSMGEKLFIPTYEQVVLLQDYIYKPNNSYLAYFKMSSSVLTIYYKRQPQNHLDFYLH